MYEPNLPLNHEPDLIMCLGMKDQYTEGDETNFFSRSQKYGST